MRFVIISSSDIKKETQISLSIIAIRSLLVVTHLSFSGFITIYYNYTIKQPEKMSPVYIICFLIMY